MDTETFLNTLKGWPYATKLLRALPRSDLIEEHAMWLTARTLSIGNLIAYVGSGTSMAYGRVSWRQLAVNVASAALHDTSANSHSPSSTSIRTLLTETLKYVRKNSADRDGILPMFELAQSLYLACGKPQGLMKAIESQVKNDVVHLAQFLPEKETIPDKPYTLTAISDLTRSRNFSGQPISQTIAKKFLKRKGHLIAHRYLAPQQRFILEYLALPTAEQVKLHNQTPTPAQRSEIVPAERDPIGTLLKTLRIHRYLTLNYDREIERLFEDGGMTVLNTNLPPRGLNLNDQTTNPLSPKYQSFVLDDDTAGDLVAFSLNDTREEYTTFHLHGQGQVNLVVTEADYRRRYARSFPRTSLLESASRLTLSCNPLLFLGVGMSEEDVLRPLRQIVDNTAVHPDRLVVALLPAPNSEKEALQPIKLFHRYGIYTIGYGIIEINGKPENILAQCRELIEALRAVVNSENLSASRRTCKKLMALPILATGNLSTLAERVDAAINTNCALSLELWFLGQLAEQLATVGNIAPLLPEERQRLNRTLTEIDGGITSTMLVAKLREIHSRSRVWMTNWSKLPTYRVPLLHTRANHANRAVQIFTRHAQLQASQSGTDPSQRYLADAASTTFRDFFVALDALPKSVTRPHESRIFLVTGRRGVGKGYFSSALTSCEKLKLLATRINENRDFHRVCYINLGTSSQIGSAIDSLIAFFADSPIDAKTLTDINNQARINSLRRSLPDSSKSRHLLVVNGIHRLLGREGYAKNAQILRVLNALILGNPKANLDIVLVGDIEWTRYCATCNLEPNRTNGEAHVFGSGGHLLPDGRKSHTHGDSFYEMLRRRPHIQYTLTRSEPIELVCNYFHDLFNLFSEVATSKVEVTSTRQASGRLPGDSRLGNAARGEQNPGGFKDPSRELSNQLVSAMARVWERTGRNRYLMCVILSCCDEKSRPTPGVSDTPERNSSRRAAALEFMAKIDSDLASVRTEQRAVGTIDAVLREYQSQSENGEPSLAASSKVKIDHTECASAEAHEEISRISSGVAFNNLMQVIVWHLAVIDQPFEGITLGDCPIVKRALGKIEHTALVDKTMLVSAALTVLQARSLVFAFTSRANEQSDADWRACRYSVHRVVQLTVFTKLGSSFLEFPQIDYFTVSLYATQPDDLPSLNADAHSNLMRTVAGLSGYPESEDFEIFHSQKSASRKAAMLRGALGILRSVFSVAVLLRQSPIGRGHPDVLESGVLEEHRRLAYWVLRASIEISAPEQSDPGKSARPSSLERRQLADSAILQLNGTFVEDGVFYREEVAWLLNEVGLISLIQGRLHDSLSLLDRALKVAEDIDGTSRGALCCRIGLNRVIVDIERGRFTDALRLLDVVASATDETVVMKRVVDGYRGLVFHLKGRISEAERYYRQALDGIAIGGTSGISHVQRRYADRGLIVLCRSRAASIFARHLGDLQRARGDLIAARESLKLSLHLAQEGRHEDVRHLTILSMTRLGLEKNSGYDPRVAHAQIMEVEKYSRELGLPRITAEALEISARYQLFAGDAQSARELALSALELANLHGLRLRKISCMLVLAKALFDLRDLRASSSIASAAMRSAERSDYHAAFAEAQQLLARLGAFDKST